MFVLLSKERVPGLNCFLVCWVTGLRGDDRPTEQRMSYAILVSVDPMPQPGALGGSVRAACTMWRAVVRGSAAWLILIALFVSLQLADIVTTNIGLTLPGNWEANPLMAIAQTHLGVFWWIPKAAVVFFVCFAAPFTRRRWLMVYAVGYCALTVSGNLLTL